MSLSRETLAKRFEVLHFYALMAIALTLPYFVRVSNILIIAAVVFALVYFFTSGRVIKNKPMLALTLGLYFMSFIGVITSENTRPAMFDLEQKLPLLAFPVLFSLGPTLTVSKVRAVTVAFMIGVGGACLYGFRNGFLLGITNDELYSNLPLNHPYLGMYCAFCFFVSLEFMRTGNRRMSLTFAAVALAFFAYILILFAKMAVLVTIMGLPLYIIVVFFITGRRSMAYGVLAVIIVIAIYGTLVNEKGKQVTHRILTFTEFNWDAYNPRVVNSVNLRFLNWSCSAEVLFTDNHWLIGTGTGDTQRFINECYSGKVGESSFLVTDNFNSHCQYLTTWLNLGLIAFIYLVFHFVMTLRRHILNENGPGILLTMAIIMFCLTESLFETQKGVTFYALFQCMFLFTPIKNSQPGALSIS